MKSLSEQAVRARAKARGLKLEKSRSRCEEWLGHGTYRVVDPFINQVVHYGPHDTFGLTLEDCAEFIDGHTGIGASRKKHGSACSSGGPADGHDA